MAAPIVTWQDLIEHGLAYLDFSSAQSDTNLVRRATRNAVTRVAAAHPWGYLEEHQRIVTNAPYTTGTLAITNGSTTVTLSGGTFPSWAAHGELVVSGDAPAYPVASRDSDTQLTLVTAFQETTVTAASYSLHRLAYDLAADFREGVQVYQEDNQALEYISPNEWLRRHRSDPASDGDPVAYTIMGSAETDQRMAVRFYPAPDAAATFDVIGVRWPRDLKVNYATGTVAATADSTSITGSGTSWDSDMVGAVLRIGDASNIPNGADGTNPYAEEHVIAAVGSTTGLTLETAADDTHSDVKYRISDPVDLDVRVCLEVLHRAVEWEIDRMHPARRRHADQSGAYYKEAMQAARDADSQFQGDGSGMVRPRPVYEVARIVSS